MADSKKVQVFSSGGAIMARAPGDAPVQLSGGAGSYGVLTVATLPAAATAGAGATAFVTDSNATTTAGIGATVAGGGANKVPVYSDGINWKIG
jgi:hypothetical protein